MFQQEMHVYIVGCQNLATVGRLLGGGFKDFLFSPLPGEMIHFD